jgi:hypothetical protein
MTAGIKSKTALKRPALIICFTSSLSLFFTFSP